MISVRNVLYSAGMKSPISILKDVIRNDAVMPSSSLRELLDFEHTVMDRVLVSLFGWSKENIKSLHETEPLLIQNPHRNHLFWHKGQTHCHSIEGPDGDTRAYQLESDYKAKGYTFICLTNHNCSTQDPLLKGILHISSAEDGFKWGHHLCILGINFEKLDHALDGDDMDGVPKYWTRNCDNIKPRIDYVTKVQNAIAIVAHPTIGHGYFDLGWDLGELKNMDHQYTGIELFTAAWNKGKGAWSVDWWDQAFFALGWRWGVAADDHEKHKNNLSRLKDFNRGWINVNSTKSASAFLDKNENELKNDILENIKRGNFVAIVRSPYTKEEEIPIGDGIDTPGPKLRIGVLADLMIVETNHESKFLFRGMTKQEQQFSRSPEAGYYDKTHAVYKLKRDEAFVRVEVEQTGSDGQIYRAYSQPLISTFWYE